MTTYVDIEKTLPTSVLRKYHGKIRAFKLFAPMRLTVGTHCSIEYEPGKYADEDEFKKMNIPLEEKKYLKAENVGFDNLNNAYLYDFENKKQEDYDDIDKEFMNESDQNDHIFTEYMFYGLHTYGGYHGFFRPDLNEVINLISKVVKKGDLKDIIRIYITTEAHPSDNINDCYDREADKHKAKTTIYVVRKDESIEEVETKRIKRKKYD